MSHGNTLGKCARCGKDIEDYINDFCEECEFKEIFNINTHSSKYYKENKKIIFTNGCFDLFHNGHLQLLSGAEKLGGELHVGINSDESIRRLKGPNRPIIPQDQRFEILASIKYVDRVYIFDEPTPKELIEQIMPDIVVKGGDWDPEDVVGRHVAKVVTIPLLEGISTTNIIKKIHNDCL